MTSRRDSLTRVDTDMRRFCMTQRTGTFKPFRNDVSFGKTVCYPCHRAKNYIFTEYRFRYRGSTVVSAFQRALKIHRRTYGNDKSGNSTDEGGADS
jgi:hypothetical protein